MKRTIAAAFILAASALILGIEKNAMAADKAFAEDSAVEKIASDIYDKKEGLKNRKIGVFDFSNLNGKETPEGKRLSKKLLEKLMAKGSLTFVERSEIDKLLKAQGIEQTGVVDADSLKESGKVMSIDVMITGTLAILGPKEGELSVKGVNISSGEIVFMTSVRFTPDGNFSYKENQKALKLHREAPDKAEMVNRTFNALNAMSANRPLIFLLAVMTDEEVAMLKSKKPKLADRLEKKRGEIEARPNLNQRMANLKKGLGVMKGANAEKYDLVMKKKEELLNRKGTMK